MVVMITGRVANADLPASEPGLKVVPVSGNAMLVGHSDAVDAAVRRIAAPSWPTDLTRMAEERQAGSEFWAIGSPALVGPQAVGAGVKRIYMTVSIRDRFISDVAFEFNAVPTAATLKTWQTSLGAISVEGNVAHVRMYMEASEVQRSSTRLLQHLRPAPVHAD